MRSIRLATYEKQLEEAAAKVHRLERKLRHSEAARTELDEARCRQQAFDAAHAAQQADALQRVEALEATLASREADAASAMARREEEASALRRKVEAQVTGRSLSPADSS